MLQHLFCVFFQQRDLDLLKEDKGFSGQRGSLKEDHSGPGPNVSPAVISYLWVPEIITQKMKLSKIHTIKWHDTYLLDENLSFGHQGNQA